MKYEKVLVISDNEAEQINKFLHVEPKDSSECLGEDDTFTRTAVFENGIEMDVKCCGSQYQEGESNLAWTEAVLFKNGWEVSFSEPEEEYLGEWSLDYEGNDYVVKVITESEEKKMQNFEELMKILISEKPSQHFSRQDENLPELSALSGVEQDAFHHPEGDAWNHTMLVLDEAAKLKNQAENPEGFMLAALCHDFGKAVTTSVIDGKIRSFGHDKEGVEITRLFLERMGTNSNYVLNMVQMHMQPNQLISQGSKAKAFRRMFAKSICPNDLILLAKADHLGRGGDHDYTEQEARLKSFLQQIPAC